MGSSPNPAGNGTSAPASSFDATTFPYRKHADIPPWNNINLHPPDNLLQVSKDPVTAALQQIQGLLNSLNRTERLLAAPWLTPPPDAESFHLAAGITIPTEADGIYHPVVKITCPPGRNGVLNQIANEFVGGGFNDFSGAIVYQIQRNQTVAGPTTPAERNYQAITASLGQVNKPTKIAPIRIFENDTIQLAVTNVGITVAGQLIGGLLGGWFYPKGWDDQFERGDQSNSW